MNRKQTSLPLEDYECMNIHFGLHGIAATFQRLMDQVLLPISDCKGAYIDDIIVFSDNWEDHLKYLRRMLTTFEEQSLNTWVLR